MNTLKLYIYNPNEGRNIFLLDGKALTSRRGKRGSRLYIYRTTKDVVHLSAETYLPTRTTFWWISWLFYFLISVFGIFDTHENFKCQTIALEADIKLSPGENEVGVRLRVRRQGKEAAHFDTTCPVQILQNVCTVDTVAKKRRVILRISKCLIFAAAVIVAAMIWIV